MERQILYMGRRAGRSRLLELEKERSNLVVQLLAKGVTFDYLVNFEKKVRSYFSNTTIETVLECTIQEMKKLLNESNGARV